MIEADITLAPTHTSGRVECDGLGYEIQMARASDGVWYQRHVWLHIPSLGGELETPTVERWIIGSPLGPLPHMREVPHEQSE